MYSAKESIHQEGKAIIKYMHLITKPLKYIKPHKIKVSKLNSHSWIL